MAFGLLPLCAFCKESRGAPSWGTSDAGLYKISWHDLVLHRASRSKLKPFVKAARTIRRHFDGVIAYVKTRLTNGLVEGLNNKLRMIARRAFGFHRADALIAMLFLNSGGIQLDPPLPEIHPLEL